METFMQNSVLREIEKRMFTLNTQVTNARGGLKNKFKYMWRKPKSTKSEKSQ